MKKTFKLVTLLFIAAFAVGSGQLFAGKGGGKGGGGNGGDDGGGSTTCSESPIVMIHGYSGSTSNFNTMESRLLNDGVPSCAIYKFGYNSLGDSNKTSASKLKSFVDSALGSTGYSTARLIAHSNGGLVSRWYRVFEGGSSKTSRLITLGTPHKGTTWAYGCVSPACFEMRPNSSFLQDLNGKGCDVSIWSDSDGIIIPNDSAKCGKSTKVSGVSHNGLLTDSGVYTIVKNKL